MIEDDLRLWAAEARADTPPVALPNLTPRKPWVPVAAAVVIVAAVAVAVPFLTSSKGATGPSRPAIGAVSGPGLRAVTFHGLTVDVPATWPTDDVQCGTPVHDTVILAQIFAACGTTKRSDVSYAWFAGGGSSDSVQHPVTTRLTLHGHAVMRSTGIVDGQPAISYQVPSLSASVLLVSSIPATLDRLDRSVSIVDTDVNGCAASSTDVLTLPTGRAPVRDGARTQVIPAGATGMVLCFYQGGFIERSGVLTAPQLLRLSTALNTAPAGTSRVPTRDYLASLCDETSENVGYRALVSYPSGPAVTVVARLSLCGDLGASNGTRVVQRVTSVVDALTALIPASSYSDEVTPTR